MAGPVVLRLPPGSELEERYPRQFLLSAGRARVVLSEPSEALLQVVRGLLGEGVEESGTLRNPTAELADLLAELVSGGGLCRAVIDGGRDVATAVPRAAPCEPTCRVAKPGARLVLSRFATLHRGAAGLTVVSPRSRAKLLLHDPAAAALFQELATPTDPGTLESDELSPEALAAVVALAYGAEILTTVDEDGVPAEDRDPSLRQWEAHDLVFHARSRSGRHGSRLGATYRLDGELEALPAFRHHATDQVVKLHRPDLDRLAREDPPLTRVVEERRSRRSHGEQALRLEELGELLYRAVGARGSVSGGSVSGGRYETSERPYPGGGAAYELEVYLAVSRCRGLEPGLFHYEPDAHRLARLSGRTPEVDRLLHSARRTAGAETEPQVLMILAARFRRVFWKYSSIGYATILKDAGVLIHNVYLAATAMDLAVCALGGGDSDLFAAASGTNYYDETSVAELILGSRAESRTD